MEREVVCGGERYRKVVEPISLHDVSVSGGLRVKGWDGGKFWEKSYDERGRRAWAYIFEA